MKFKYIALSIFFGCTLQFGFAQSNSDLLNHYKAYYAQMQAW